MSFVSGLGFTDCKQYVNICVYVYQCMLNVDHHYNILDSFQLRLPRGSSEIQPWSMRLLGSKGRFSLVYYVFLFLLNAYFLALSVNSCPYVSRGRNSGRQSALLAISEDRIAAEVEIDAPEEFDEFSDVDDFPSVSVPSTHFGETSGRPGFLSFYNRPYKRENETIAPVSQRKDSDISWLVGPAVLVASFILPSLYLRKVISIVFEDSLLTGEFFTVYNFF